MQLEQFCRHSRTRNENKAVNDVREIEVARPADLFVHQRADKTQQTTLPNSAWPATNRNYRGLTPHSTRRRRSVGRSWWYGRRLRDETSPRRTLLYCRRCSATERLSRSTASVTVAVEWDAAAASASAQQQQLRALKHRTGRWRTGFSGSTLTVVGPFQLPALRSGTLFRIQDPAISTERFRSVL